jgi:hypothetical protein
VAGDKKINAPLLDAELLLKMTTPTTRRLPRCSCLRN